LNPTDQPDGRAAIADNLFYIQGHVGTFKRNERASRNSRKDGKLQGRMMLSFRHMPNYQHSSAGVRATKAYAGLASKRDRREVPKPDLYV